MNNQGNKGKEENKGYSPEKESKGEVNNESNEPKQNLKWDQAQRRQQAGPRSYNESLESENISNQNTEAGREQISDNEGDDPNDPKMIGDQISERQQTIDEKNAPGKQDRDRKKD